MYYQEKIINGVLCSKSTPDGEFEPLSSIALNRKVIELMKQNENLHNVDVKQKREIMANLEEISKHTDLTEYIKSRNEKMETKKEN